MGKEAEAFKDRCYEAYRLEWMLSHGHGIGDLMDALESALEDEVLSSGDITSADEVDESVAHAKEAMEDNGLGSGTLWVCREEFLSHEFLDKDYMAHLIDLMPDRAENRRLYTKTTGICLEEEHLEVYTSAGVLSAYKSADPGQPGICVMLNPAGYEEEIDLSFVSVYEDPSYATGDNERPIDVAVMAYADPYSEDYTLKAVIRREDVMAALDGCKTGGGPCADAG